MIIRAICVGAAVLAFVAADGSAQAGYGTDEGPSPAPYKHRHARHAPYRDCCGEVYRYVYAESWYGFKRVVAPVRRAEHGDQVRLPGGTWVYCEFNCESTLRKQSLDFWTSKGGAGGDDQSSPGYFRRDFYFDDWGHRRGYLF